MPDLESLPPELAEHIREHSIGLSQHFIPHIAGAAENPYFIPNETRPYLPPSSSPLHKLEDGIVPPELRSLYESFPSDCEFEAKNGWLFFSADEIRSRRSIHVDAGQKRLVEFAFRYAGLGHIITCCLDPVSGLVFEEWDGGSNGYERQSNLQRKQKLDVELLESKKDFMRWFEERVLVHDESPM